MEWLSLALSLRRFIWPWEWWWTGPEGFRNGEWFFIVLHSELSVGAMNTKEAL